MAFPWNANGDLKRLINTLVVGESRRQHEAF